MPKGRQPLPERTRKREYDRLRQQRLRARKKAEAAQRAEQEAAHRAWLHARRLDNLTPMNLIRDLHFDDGRVGYSLSCGTRIWVQEGLQHLFEKALLAAPVAEMQPLGYRVITDTPPDRFVTEEPEPPRERTSAGY